jgi:hypothetical protein
MIANIAIVFLSFLLLCICFVCFNRLLKKTNWYKNIFIYTNQFEPRCCKTADPQYKYDIVNLGSNVARYAFFYESIFGQNWSTGSQSLKEDFLILKNYYSHINKNGVVLLPIAFFSSISFGLNFSAEYFSKFISLYRNESDIKIPTILEATLLKKYPLLARPFSMRYIIRDMEKNNHLFVSNQVMQQIDLDNDANRWFNLWKKQFKIDDFSAPMSDYYRLYFDEAVLILKKIIDFCFDKQLKPILVIPPVTKPLSFHLTLDAREQYIYSFIRKANIQDVPCLNYLDDNYFSKPEYYSNSYFMNLKGRKLFTRQVLTDLDFI